MAFVRVEQRSAHLATPVRLTTVSGRNGPVSKATFTAISNAWRGSGDAREEEATAILWTLWGRAAENAAQFLSKGSHVNISGRVQNSNYDKDGTTVYGMAFTAEQVDYLDSKSTSDALRERQEGQQGAGEPAAGAVVSGSSGTTGAAGAGSSGPGQGRTGKSGAVRGRKSGAGSVAKVARMTAHASTAGAVNDDDIPF